MRIDRRSAVKLLAAPVFSGGLFVASARAQQYPGKPIRIIVPYPAGGPYDGIPRLIAQWISAQQGWPIHAPPTTRFHPAPLPRTLAAIFPLPALEHGLTELIAGNVHYITDSTREAPPPFARGKLRPLAATSLKRSPRLPDVPTMAEL